MPLARKTPTSRRDRPAKAPLTRQGIVEVAVRIMREEGLERATMRRLAAELDTGPASLYVYVHHTAELHVAVLDHLLGDLDLGLDLDLDLGPDTGEGGWRGRLVELLIGYTQLLVTQPSLARAVLALRPSEPNYLRLVDSILALLHAGGVPTRQAAWGVDLLLAQATSIGAEQGTRDESVEAPEEEEAVAVLVGGLPTAEYPNIAQVSEELLSGSGEQRIRWAFSALIGGIATTTAPSPDDTVADSLG